MQKINTNEHLHYKKIADVMIDRNRLMFETIGMDEAGNYILHRSITINMSSGYGEESEYYILNDEEVKRYLGSRALSDSSSSTSSSSNAKPKKGKGWKKPKKHRR